MEKMKKLPDAEFDIMKVVWANEPPVTTSGIMKYLGNEKEWKIQTVVSLMLRLVSEVICGLRSTVRSVPIFPL